MDANETTRQPSSTDTNLDYHLPIRQPTHGWLRPYRKNSKVVKFPKFSLRIKNNFWFIYDRKSWPWILLSRFWSRYLRFGNSVIDGIRLIRVWISFGQSAIEFKLSIKETHLELGLSIGANDDSTYPKFPSELFSSNWNIWSIWFMISMTEGSWSKEFRVLGRTLTLFAIMKNKMHDFISKESILKWIGNDRIWIYNGSYILDSELIQPFWCLRRVILPSLKPRNIMFLTILMPFVILEWVIKDLEMSYKSSCKTAVICNFSLIYFFVDLTAEKNPNAFSHKIYAYSV